MAGSSPTAAKGTRLARVRFWRSIACARRGWGNDVPIDGDGLPHLRAKLDELAISCLRGSYRFDPAHVERQMGEVVAAIEYVSWRLQLDWDVINARSAAETLRLQQQDKDT